MRGMYMFVQIIQGHVADPAALDRAMHRWLEDLRPGATGWLGSTSGVTDDGRAIMLARFESAESAQANSERPEQGAWWSETEKAFDGPVTFHDSTDIETMLGGGSDEAGFVQVIQSRSPDPGALRSLQARFEPTLRELHTGLLGSIYAWYGDGEFTEFVYFTDEAEARAGEQALAEHAEGQEGMEEFQSLIGEPTFFDLRSPRFDSA